MLNKKYFLIKKEHLAVKCQFYICYSDIVKKFNQFKKTNAFEKNLGGVFCLRKNNRR